MVSRTRISEGGVVVMVEGDEIDAQKKETENQLKNQKQGGREPEERVGCCRRMNAHKYES